MWRLNLQYFAGEKTEKATPKKRQEGRKKGQVVKSIDLSTAFSMLAFFLLFMAISANMGQSLLQFMSDIYTNWLNTPLNEHNIQTFSLHVFKAFGVLIAPILILALIMGIGSQLMQVGFVFSTESLQFKMERLDPIQGFKRIYSLRAIVEFIKSLLKILVIGWITFSVLWLNRSSVLQTMVKPIGESLLIIGKVVLQMGIASSLGLIVLGFLDYLYQKFDYEKNMRMSKQDIKDEYKKSEGDPLIKSKIKERQRQMAMRRMMQELPKADVVITNPTHFAVALMYDNSQMEAPKVVAKGADYLALKIREIAKQNDIVIVEKKPLARAMYKELEIGDSVPETFFKAVAEILAYVYRLKGKV
ncbi:flagellar biosynthesis protein FlhB [Terrilactibacillus laevilacticus]|uniref:Flagellar biosynthetic protein FlhB n=1 Tax=Terrilactibacillus laevilacticus TaxID=1380157 RepID=A0ABW5PPS7_9BACI|nr:flagellar biosynthesis protein FlhB [Terrilactibacillus laevilacticus]